MDIDRKKTMTMPNEYLNNTTRMEYGDGNRYHKLLTKHFDSAADFNKYQTDTGLTEDTGVKQSWGTSNSQHQVLRSRRGSLGGAVQNNNGSIESWRMSSFATSEALDHANVDSAEHRYLEAASELASKPTNTKGTQLTPNAVLSDFGKVSYNAFGTSGNMFQLTQATNAMGMSGAGLDSKTSISDKHTVFAPSEDTMTDRGKTPTSSLAFHSEPMAVTLHNLQRQNHGLGTLEQESEMVGIMESFPNQICAQCGPMLSQRVGTNSVVSGNPGVPFGGQKEGKIDPASVLNESRTAQLGKATVFRAAPIKEFGANDTNLQQVRAIHGEHSK